MTRKYLSIGILLSMAALALSISGWPAFASEKPETKQTKSFDD